MIKKINITTLLLGSSALIASFFPMISAGNLFVAINHIQGAATLLYFIPMLIIGLGVLGLINKIQNIKPWLIASASLGLLLLILTMVMGINHLNAFGGISNGFSEYPIKVGRYWPGIGGVILFLSYTGAIALGVSIKTDGYLSDNFSKN